MKLKKTLECRNMYCKLKYVVIYLKLLTNFVILKSFGNIINNYCMLHTHISTTKWQWVTFQLAMAEHGVPQGSILGPLLFLLYINSMPQAIIIYSKLLLHADDTTNQKFAYLLPHLEKSPQKSIPPLNNNFQVIIQ